jgi:hypothetical protein
MLLLGVASTGSLGLAACLGGVQRNYVTDGGAEGPATGDDVAVDAPVDGAAESTPGMDGGGAPDGDAMTVGETTPPNEASPPVEAGQTFSCNGTMVTSCASCPGKPIECVFCGQGGTNPGVCGPANMYCSNSAPGGATTCTCNGGAQGNLAACPAPFQVCTYIGMLGGQFYCQTCGEMGSDMEVCKGGGKCSDMTGKCQ